MQPKAGIDEFTKTKKPACAGFRIFGDRGIRTLTQTHAFKPLLEFGLSFLPVFLPSNVSIDWIAGWVVDYL